jgi:hypothetical protein
MDNRPRQSLGDASERVGVEAACPGAAATTTWSVTMIEKVSAGIGALLLCGGCGPGEVGLDGKAVPPADQQGIVRTIVRMSEAGEPEVTTETIQQADFDREVEVREALMQGASSGGAGRTLAASNALTAATLDTGCSGSSIWLFDSPGNRPGSFPTNHEICFYASSPQGFANLATFCRIRGYFPGGQTCLRWWGSRSGDDLSGVASYWTGVDSVDFFGYHSERFIYPPYGYKRVDVAPGTHLTWLNLTRP